MKPPINIDQKRWPAFTYAMADFGDSATLSACEEAADKKYGYPEAARDEGLARDELHEFLEEREDQAWRVGMSNAACVVGWGHEGLEHIADELGAHAEAGRKAFPRKQFL